MRRFISMAEEDGTTLEFGARSTDTDADISAAPWYVAMTPPEKDPEWQSVVLYASTEELLGFLLQTAQMIHEVEGLSGMPAAERNLSTVTAADIATKAARSAGEAAARGPRPGSDPGTGHGKT